MCSPALLLLLSTISVTFGYEPSSDADRGYDYIVQVEPELLDRMREGQADAIEANVPPEVSPIRRIRVVVGKGDLPRELRAASDGDHAVQRTAYRTDAATASPPIDLLAQTGPAGGFGRNATGFSGGPRATTPNTPPRNSAPGVGNTPAEIGRQLDTGFQYAERGFYDARDSARGAVNTIGERGQQAIDNGRQLLSDTIAPPEQRSFDPDGRPIDNVLDRAQSEVRNTADAFRDSYDRLQQNTRDAFGARSPAAEPRYNTPAVEPPAPTWDDGNDPSRVAQHERSVLAGNRPPVETPPNQGVRQENTDYRQVQPPSNQPAGTAAADRTRDAEGFRDDPNLRFPEQPQDTRSQMRPLPETGSHRQGNNIVNRMVDPNAFDNQPARNDGWGQEPFAGGVDQNRFNDWVRNGSGQQHFVTGDGQGDRFDAPALEIARPRPDQQAGRPANDLWGEDAAGQQATDGDSDSSGSGSTPAWILGWVIAIGSVVTNLFQWLNIVDMRNKYRVALRRSSPGFTRSTAG